MTGAFSLAVHALVYLNHMNKCLSSEQLAQNICTNAVTVRKVMNLLKKAQLVDTKEGNAGGYLFVLDASKVTLAHIANAVGTDFVSASWRSGNHDMECLVASGMADVMDGVYADLNKTCINWLSKITIADIDSRIFTK